MDTGDTGHTGTWPFAQQCATAWGVIAPLGEDFGAEGVHVPVSQASQALRESGRSGAAALLVELERLLRESFMYCQYGQDAPACLTQPGGWPKAWLRALFDWDTPPEAVAYLPEFAPLKRFLATVERDFLPQLDAVAFRRLRKYCRSELDTLAGRGFFGPPFRSFAKDDASAALLSHLETVLLEEDIRPLAADPPLSAVFVEPDGWETLTAFTDAAEEAESSDSPDSGHMLFLTGTPGTGITTLLRMASTRLAKRCLTGTGSTIPVFILLQAFQTTLPTPHMPEGTNAPLCLFLAIPGPILASELPNAVAAMLSSLPSGSRAVIGARPQAGLPGRELALTGFRPDHVQRYLSRLADARPITFSWARLMDAARLAKVGLSAEELRSPFFLWLLAALARDAALSLPSPSLGRAGFFLAAAGFLSPLARSSRWRTAPQAGADYFAPQIPGPAGRLLRWQAAMGGNAYAGCGAIEGTDAGCGATATACTDGSATSSKGLLTGCGGLEFPDLDPVTHGFAHASIRAYALAEGLLHQLLCALTRRDWPKGLCLPGIAHLNADAAAFFHGLCQTMAAAPRSHVTAALLSGLLEAMLHATPERLNLIRSGTTHWVDRSALLELAELAARLAALPLPEVTDPLALRDEALTRWLALLFGSVVLKTMELKTIVKTYRAHLTPDALARLLRATPQPPLWCLDLLTRADLEGADLSGLDTTGLGSAGVHPARTTRAKGTARR